MKNPTQWALKTIRFETKLCEHFFRQVDTLFYLAVLVRHATSCGGETPLNTSMVGAKSPQPK